MGISLFHPCHIAELFENGHDGQLLALEVFAKGMPNHQVAEVDVAEIATLSSLEIIHEREDALTLRCVSGYEECKNNETKDEWKLVRVPVQEVGSKQ